MKIPARIALSGALALLLLGVSACDQDPAAPTSAAAGAYTLSEADQQTIAQNFPDAQVTPTGLRYIVRTPGTGDTTPRHGARVTTHYDLRLLNGTVLESSVKQGNPISFRVGMHQVIKGWDEALLTMKKGERRTLIVPHWLGYGSVGSPPKIPPYATLVFEVELIDFR